MAMTYVDALNVAIEAVADEEVIEPTKTEVENEGIKANILEVLTDEGVTVKTLLGELEGDYTSQKISALLRQLVADGKVVKTIEKKVSYFSLA